MVQSESADFRFLFISADDCKHLKSLINTVFLYKILLNIVGWA